MLKRVIFLKTKNCIYKLVIHSNRVHMIKVKSIAGVLFVFFICTSAITMKSQEASKQLPYHQIPEYPENYTAGNINARLIDGLGYRYYWASKGLTQENLNYKPSADARTILETLEHIYGLSDMILSATTSSENIRPLNMSTFNYDSLRAATLANVEKASKNLLSKSAEEIGEMKIIFGSGDNKREIPFWNLINGPIADAIYHTGQLVTLRRSDGNPMNPKVNVFMGRTGE